MESANRSTTDRSQPRENENPEDNHQVDETEWVVKFIGHVMGASMVVLPYAMGQLGIAPFVIVLMTELYVTGNSLNLFCEMAQYENGIDHTNYFSIMDKYLGRNRQMVRKMIRFVFLFDVVICSSFYFKVGEELVFSCYAGTTNTKHRSAYRIAGFFALAFFLLLSEFISRKLRPSYPPSKMGQNVHLNPKTETGEPCETDPMQVAEKDQQQQLQAEEINSSTSSEVNFVSCKIFNLHMRPSKYDHKASRLDMRSVVTRLHGYSSLRLFFLPLPFFLLYALGEEYSSIRGDNELLEMNHTICPGLLKPFLLPEPDMKILSGISAIIFSLMHYSIFLPICLEELNLPPEEYSGLVKKGSLVLLMILLTMPLFVHLTLGESAPVLFTTAYGNTFPGMILTLLAFVMTTVAMLLRIIGCCKLIQVLFNWRNDSQFWGITIGMFFSSFAFASFAKSILYLVIIAGLVNSNLLLIIFPRLAYFNFKQDRGERWTNFNLVSTALGVFCHSILLVCAIPALDFAEPYIGEHCADIFNEYWSA